MSEQSPPEAVPAQRRPALANVADTSATSISIHRTGPQVRYSLRLREHVAPDAGAPGAPRLAMPLNTCRVTEAATTARLGPDEWWVLAGLTAGDSLARDLRAELANRFFSLTDISHRNVGLIIAGAQARAVLNGGCPLDLGDDAFPPASATRTLFGKAEVVLLRPTAERLYWLECGRSFAPYVRGLLGELAREFTAS